MPVIYNYKALEPPLTTSYAQEGEDIILCKLFTLNGNRVKRGGVYVDVGAHHPVRFSTTCLFHQRFGWTGINIDPNPGFKALFDAQRPADINLELGVSSFAGERDFHLFDDPALNTFDEDYVRLVKSWNTRKYLGVLRVQVDTLAGVFDKHLRSGSVDLLNVDAEGHDFEVLKSGDWKRHRPHVVLVESLEQDLRNLEKDPVYLLMTRVGYELIAKTCSTFFYRDRYWKEWQMRPSGEKEQRTKGGGRGEASAVGGVRH